MPDDDFAVDANQLYQYRLSNILSCMFNVRDVCDIHDIRDTVIACGVVHCVKERKRMNKRKKEIRRERKKKSNCVCGAKI